MSLCVVESLLILNRKGHARGFRVTASSRRGFYNRGAKAILLVRFVGFWSECRVRHSQVPDRADWDLGARVAGPTHA